MAKNNIRLDTPQQKEIYSRFRYLSDRYGPWQIWSDFITLFACCLSLSDREQRDAERDAILKRYRPEDMCQHWDDVRGCLMKSPNCDDCTKFQRIRPQYCRMCGGEFLERREQTFCPKCRAMRKKQAQRKYAVLRARGRL